jgi:hypothetical protein
MALAYDGGGPSYGDCSVVCPPVSETWLVCFL